MYKYAPGMPRGIKILLIALAAVVVMVGTLLIVLVVTDYRPETIEELDFLAGQGQEPLETDAAYRMLTFNIGYCGLGNTQDFFMDGGRNSRAGSRAEVENNLAAIEGFLKTASMDFICLQEVDEDARRSYSVNQRQQLSGMNGQSTVFAYNYKVPFVPVPLYSPMGKVRGGLLQLSQAVPASAERFAFDAQEAYPVQFFELDRCFTVSRFPVGGKNELVLINAHFSAYDKGGTIREQQLAQMKSFLQMERDNGNYVILAGDFNHQLPGTDAASFKWEGEVPEWCQSMPEDFTPAGYTWAVDASAPTCRNNDAPYKAGVNFVVVLDGFLVSDNVLVEEVKVQDMGFTHSDHQPVAMTFRLQ